VQPALNTERRALNRTLFDEHQTERLREAELISNEQRLKHAEQEKAEIKRIRRHMSFKASPMPVFREFFPKKSEKNLTIPKSPRLQTQTRGCGVKENSRQDLSQHKRHETETVVVTPLQQRNRSEAHIFDFKFA
jgi:hypothetical protein